MSPISSIRRSPAEIFPRFAKIWSMSKRGTIDSSVLQCCVLRRIFRRGEADSSRLLIRRTTSPTATGHARKSRRADPGSLDAFASGELMPGRRIAGGEEKKEIHHPGAKVVLHVVGRLSCLIPFLFGGGGRADAGWDE